MVCADGSKQGIGGYLFQIIGGEERVISYFSRATRADEKKWDTRVGGCGDFGTLP